MVSDGLVLNGARSRIIVVSNDAEITVIQRGVNHYFTLVDPLAAPRAVGVAGGRVCAPIPGRVTALNVAVGDIVTQGQVLVLLEAMKMEIALVSPADGIVQAVLCAVGDMVAEARELVDVTAGDD